MVGEPRGSNALVGSSTSLAETPRMEHRCVHGLFGNRSGISHSGMEERSFAHLDYGPDDATSIAQGLCRPVAAQGTARCLVRKPRQCPFVCGEPDFARGTVSGNKCLDGPADFCS